MARISKQRGYALERKLVLWFSNEEKRKDWPQGWKAERNILSREAKSFGVTTGKHDIKAIKEVADGEIFLQIEAKKTGKELHTIQWKWIKKIDFTKDEILVFAMARTNEFVMMSKESFCKQFSRTLPAKPNYSYKGAACFRLHASEVENVTWEKPVILEWDTHGLYVIVPLVEYVQQRELLPPTRPKENKPSEVVSQPSISNKDKSQNEDIHTQIITCPHCKQTFSY